MADSSSTVNTPLQSPPEPEHTVQGECAPAYHAVREAFERNFSLHHEAGASVCVFVEGALVAHLWGGKHGQGADMQWGPETLCSVFSCTKGAVALCAHMLADEGALDFERPVAHYWPEFGQQGKAAIPLGMILNHEAGVPAIRVPFDRDALLDARALAELTARESPFWEPGARHGYHALTFGAVLDEVIYRVSGQSAGAFFHDKVAAPFGLNFWIGLPDALEAQVAPVVFPGAHKAADAKPIVDEELRTALQGNIAVLLGACTSSDFRASGLAAGGGVATAAGLAGMYLPLSLGGSFGGRRLLSEATIARISQAQPPSRHDVVLGIPTAFNQGFTTSWCQGEWHPGQGFCLGASAFGHSGMGGSVGFADPANHVAFGYVMNRLNGLPSLDERAQGLIDAVYRSIGLSSRDSGCWQ